VIDAGQPFLADRGDAITEVPLEVGFLGEWILERHGERGRSVDLETSGTNGPPSSTPGSISGDGAGADVLCVNV